MTTFGASARCCSWPVVWSPRFIPANHAKDVAFDSALLGSWVEADKTNADAETWAFEKLEARTCKLIVAENAKQTEFDTHLFKLKGALFLDCLPRERPDNSAPLHFLMRVDALTPELKLRLLNFEWLTRLVEKDPRAIRRPVVPKKVGDGHVGGDLVLTADTTELQKFIAKHL